MSWQMVQLLQIKVLLTLILALIQTFYSWEIKCQKRDNCLKKTQLILQTDYLHKFQSRTGFILS